MKMVRINEAEAIIEAFWDPSLSEISQWHIEEQPQYGLVVKQQWSWVNFEWRERPKDGKVLDAYKNVNINCDEYDYLILSVVVPPKGSVKVFLTTDRGSIEYISEPFGELGKELFVPLQKAINISKIHIQAEVIDQGIGIGILKWIGLHNSKRYEHYKKQWQVFDDQWEGYLKDEDYNPNFEPTYGIVINKEELERLRVRHEKFLNEKGTSPFTQKIQGIKDLRPEESIHEHVNFWDDTRYERERDYFKRLTKKGPELAEAGILLKDKKLLRLAARYAMSMAMCKNWNDSFICNFTAGTWEHRAFVKSIIAHEIGTILDLAGEMFTDLGRDLILRRLGEEAIGGINYITWKHDYIFENNQLIWFSHGRMLAYAILEQHFNHVKPYTEIAYQDIIENLNHIIFEDGGYGEGPSYYNCIGQHALLALYYYSRLRQVEFEVIVPDKVKRTEDFIECLFSTVQDQDVIPICDGKTKFEQETVGFMSFLLPHSRWSQLFVKSIKRTQGMAQNLIVLNLLENSKLQYPTYKPFTMLEEMGIVASLRQVGKEQLKIFIMGNKADIDHAHEDKGSFVIEFAGDTFAMDSASCDYSKLISGVVQHCQRHNMLVPFGVDERPCPDRPNHVDIKVKGTGDECTFNAQVDLTSDWKNYYKEWKRSIISETPEKMKICDEYELIKGKGVIFYWKTQLDVTTKENQVFIKGMRGQMTLSVPEYCTIEIKEEAFHNGTPQKSINIYDPRLKDKLVIQVQVEEI